MHDFSFFSTFLTTSALIKSGALCLFAGSIVLAQVPGNVTPQIVLLPAGNSAATQKSEKVDKNGIISNVSQPSFTVYPACGAKKSAGLIICPGGGYEILDYQAHVAAVVPIFNKAGITVFGLKYRVSPPSKDAPLDALSDLKTTLRMIRMCAAEWNVDPDRIGVQGYSAGAHLVLSLITATDLNEPAAADSLGRTNARPNFMILMCPWPKGRNAQNFHLLENTPPTYIAHAQDDDIAAASFSKGLKAQLDNLGVPAVLRLVPKGGHLAFNYKVPKGDPTVPWIEEVIAWLKTCGFISK